MSSNDGENWVLGVTLGLLGSIAINTGNNVQSLGLKSLKEQIRPETSSERPRKQSITTIFSPKRIAPLGNNVEEAEEFEVIPMGKRRPCKSITWVIGTIIFYSGSLLNFASYAFAAQSLLASLESVQFVTNLIFGKFMLKANITREMLAGTCLIVVGTVLAVQYSSKEALDLDSNEIKNLWRNTAYLIYLGFMGGLLVFLHILYGRLDKLQKEGKPVKNNDVIMPLVYSVWSALFGTQSVVQAKVIAELVSVHSRGKENIFKSWLTYMTFLFWIVTAVVWTIRLNNALEKFDPLFIIPLLQCSFIFFAIVSGGIFFQEFNNFVSSQWIGFWFGIAIMFSGMVLLTPRPRRSREADDDLQRELVSLFLARGSTGDSCQTIERQPSGSPFPTPCHSVVLTDDVIGSNRRIGQLRELNETGNDEVMDELEGQHESVEKRTPRFSKENMYSFAMEAVREVVRESAQILTADPTTRYFSDAMVAATVEEEGRERRRKALHTLLGLMKENPPSSNGYTDEMMQLIRELNLELVVIPMGSDRDIGRHRTLSQEKLHHQILTELGVKDSPKRAFNPLDLTEKFNKQSADDQLSTRSI